MTQIEHLIRKYLADMMHMSLATTANGKPWICEVHYVYDHNLDFYFLSKPNRRHSKEISANSNVAGNIVRQHTATEHPQGVSFEGQAQMLRHLPEDHPAYALYTERFGLSPSIREEIKHDPHGHKFYQIRPAKFVLFDTVNFPDDPRREWFPM